MRFIARLADMFRGSDDKRVAPKERAPRLAPPQADLAPAAQTPLRRRKKRRDERGVALLMVLGAITVLTVFLTELQEETSSELAAALADRDALRAEYHARSAVNLTRLLISTEPTLLAIIGPAIQLLGIKLQQIPVWKFTEMVLGPFNDPAAASSFNTFAGLDPTSAKNFGLGTTGRFEVTVVDEDSKINLNAAAAPRDTATLTATLSRQLLGLFSPPSYNPLFEGRDADNQFTDRQTLCAAIIDWADSDPSGNEIQNPCDPFSTQASNTGPEDNFYQTLGLPYRRKNAPYDSFQELRLVRGVSDDTWAAFFDPKPEDPGKRNITVWSANKINVATANAETILAVICGNANEVELCTDPLQIANFLMVMQMVKSFGLPIFSSSKDFFDALKGNGFIGPILTQIGLKPVTFKNEKEVAKALTFKSKLFSIYADGIVPGYKRTTRIRIHAVVDFRVAPALGAPPMGFCGSSVTNSGGQSQLAQAADANQKQQQQPGSAGIGTPGGQQQQQPLDPASATLDQILKALNTNPAGTVVYWRVE